MSSRDDGLRSRTICRIPLDSNWKIPSRSPLARRAKVSSSWGGNLSGSTRVPLLTSTSSRVFSIIVRFFNPRKSIFNRPMDSTSSMKYCVIT